MKPVQTASVQAQGIQVPVTIQLRLEPVARSPARFTVIVLDRRLGVIERHDHYGWEWAHDRRVHSEHLTDEELAAVVVAIHNALGTTEAQRRNSGLG